MMKLSLYDFIVIIGCSVCGFCIGKTIEAGSPERKAQIKQQDEVKSLRDDVNQLTVILSEQDDEQN
jgi:hypothetical protein|tara:strand:- start:406 stop:603 length:198 start_codon:yes stop_codon:yes gene_type:complete